MQIMRLLVMKYFLVTYYVNLLIFIIIIINIKEWTL